MQYTQYKRLPQAYIENKINEFLIEDMPDGDKTTLGIFKNPEKVKAIIQAEQDLIFAGEQIISTFFKEYSETIAFFKDGDEIKNGQIISEIFAPIDYILTRERVLLNLLQRLCGIATLTKQHTQIGDKYNVKILDTRKTTPGLRLFEKFAVTAGGGFNHRLDLSSGILVKDNHIKAAGCIKDAIKKIKNENYDLPIEVEVEFEEQVIEGLIAGADGFLLDNQTPDNAKKLVKLIRNYNDKYYFIEASGGINLTNLEEYVKTGVDAISIGALTHSAKSTNIHIEIL